VRGIFGFTKEHSEVATKLVEDHGIKPAFKVFEWKDAVEAFRALMMGSVVGKIVIRV